MQTEPIKTEAFKLSSVFVKFHDGGPPGLIDVLKLFHCSFGPHKFEKADSLIYLFFQTHRVTNIIR